MFSVLFLFSCTTQFKHQSGNNSNLGNDTRYCKATANSQAPTYICRNPLMCAPDETSIVLMSISQNNAVYDQCMMSKGYVPSN